MCPNGRNRLVCPNGGDRLVCADGKDRLVCADGKERPRGDSTVADRHCGPNESSAAKKIVSRLALKLGQTRALSQNS